MRVCCASWDRLSDMCEASWGRLHKLRPLGPVEGIQAPHHSSKTSFIFAAYLFSHPTCNLSEHTMVPWGSLSKDAFRPFHNRSAGSPLPFRLHRPLLRQPLQLLQLYCPCLLIWDQYFPLVFPGFSSFYLKFGPAIAACLALWPSFSLPRSLLPSSKLDKV